MKQVTFEDEQEINASVELILRVDYLKAGVQSLINASIVLQRLAAAEEIKPEKKPGKK